MKQLTLVCVCLLWISSGVAAQSNPVPFINQPLVPESAAPGSGAFTLTVYGSGFASTAVVSWNEQFRPTTVFSSTHLQASISASDVATLGTARVKVVNVDAHNESPASLTFRCGHHHLVWPSRKIQISQSRESLATLTTMASWTW
jgi:hypothetical protein